MLNKNMLRRNYLIIQYVAISPAATFKGIEQLGVLLQAIRNRNVVNFNHLNYNTGNQTAYSAEPYLLKEFEGRWYLYAFVKEIKEFRTFGLERISDLEVTATQLENKLLGYGEQIEVLGPEGLRGRMKQRLKTALKQY
jgi:predicted DNA-binding transcriptional regulator YafY